MITETIQLFSGVHIPHTNPDAVAGTRIVLALNTEVALFGYTFSARLIETLEECDETRVRTFRTKILDALAIITGDTSNHNRLFEGFPYSTPNQWDYLNRRVIGVVQNMYDLRSGKLLSCGHYIDDRLFNLEEFGACPICQHLVSELSSGDGKRYNYRAITPLKVIDLLTTDDITDRLNAIIARKSSISKDERAFILRPEWRHVVTIPSELYRENVPVAFDIVGRDVARIIPHIVSCTDVMRIAYMMSDSDSDFSLAGNVKFKLRTSERKILLQLLHHVAGNNPISMASDMLRHRERWLRLGEMLAPMSQKNRARYPEVARAFDMLRNDPTSIPNVQRDFEALVRGKRINVFADLSVLQSRPGMFARAFDALVRRYPDNPSVQHALVKGLREVRNEIPLPTLFGLLKFYENRNSRSSRVFFIKGAANKVHYTPNPLPPLDRNFVHQMQDVLSAWVEDRFKSQAKGSRYYVDPFLDDLIVPFNQRGDSSMTVPILKGSRYPYAGDVLRMFVHWTGEIDVDLSAQLMTSDFKRTTHIGFTNLKGNGVMHSGDVQSAPNGGSEFIDFEVDTLLKTGNRYIVMDVRVYRGPKFGAFPCFAGFMERDALKSGAVYQPETVKFKFDVSASGKAMTPLIFDLKERKVIYADLLTGNQGYSAIANEATKQSELARAVVELRDRKLTFGDVAYMIIRASNGTVVDRDNADKIFDANSLEELLGTLQER